MFILVNLGTTIFTICPYTTLFRSVVAKHKENGTIYVIDSFVDRIKVDEFIEVIVEKVLEWQPDVIAVESVAAQEFFADTLKYELANAGYPSFTRMKKIYSRTRKEIGSANCKVMRVE